MKIDFFCIWLLYVYLNVHIFSTVVQRYDIGINEWNKCSICVTRLHCRLILTFLYPAAVKNEAPEKAVDPIKKQEELFQAMQAQYEVARATTHTMRGVGLGFQRGQY